jgi:prepilin-type N-terminal cleavage/methylation domain-containing protein
MKKGFTLVEMSIVMVVIGLILGMALKGKSLLDSATIRNEVNKLSLMQAAVTTLLTTSSNDGSLSELPKDNTTRGYDFIDNSFLINKGLLSAKDISYNDVQHEIAYCRYPTGNSGGLRTEETNDAGDSMLCAFTTATWPFKFHCVAETTLDDQNVLLGKGRSDNASTTNARVGGATGLNANYDCNKSEKATDKYTYILISSKLIN